MRTYKLFKQVFQIEPYLLCVKLPKHRVALTKLRVSSHHLAIETGRFHKPSALPVQERLCTTCGKIEDEIHFICECKQNVALREELFSDVTRWQPNFQKLPTIEKLVFLMQSHEPVIVNALGSFVYESFVFIK